MDEWNLILLNLGRSSAITTPCSHGKIVWGANFLGAYRVEVFCFGRIIVSGSFSFDGFLFLEAFWPVAYSSGAFIRRLFAGGFWADTLNSHSCIISHFTSLCLYFPQQTFNRRKNFLRNLAPSFEATLSKVSQQIIYHFFHKTFIGQKLLKRRSDFNKICFHLRII